MATHVPPPVGEISTISHFAAIARERQSWDGSST